MFSRLHRRDLRLVYLLLLIATIMLGSTWFGARQVESYMIQRQAENEVFNWARFSEVHIADFNQILLYGRATDADEALIAAMAEANNVLRYRFFNRAGFIVLSSVPGEVGRRDVNTYLSDVVLGGGTFIKLQEDGRFFDLEPDLHGGSAVGGDGSFRNEFELPPGSVLAEAYTAVMEDGRFNGAIEVHVNVTQTAELVRQIIGLTRWVMIGFVGLTAAVTSIVIFQNIRDRNRELADVRSAQDAAARAESEIRRLNAELEERVAQQSEQLRDARDECPGSRGLASQSR